MLSRTLNQTAKSLPRALRKPATLTSIARTAPRGPPTLAPQVSSVRSFAASSSSRSAGQSDAELAGKLKQERQWENEAGSTAEPEFLADFKKEGNFDIEDIPGSDEIALTRTFGNESIRIVFSIADVEDSGMAASEEEESEEGDDVNESNSNGIRTAIIIAKEGNGSMTIDAIADETGFAIDNVSFYDDAKLALDTSAAADWKRRSLYIGPTFENLDEDLQTAFEEYLSERGISPVLAQIITDLAEHKEQKEYVSWLGKMEQFIEA